jgi:dihydroorotate dehydrogenase
MPRGQVLACAAVYRLLRPLLFLLPAETAHRLTMLLLRLFWRVLPRARLPAGLRCNVLGIDFESPIGLAAGMDKDRALAPAWQRLGFGFVEIGTVTPRPQPGNPRPRLFRLIPFQAVINRMGFNNAGAAVVASRLAALPPDHGVICINVGRNKDTPNERAAEDYVAAFRALAAHAQLAAINVSSPNTPGLRALQDELSGLVSAVVRARNELPRRIPVLVKLSPDESDDRLIEMARAACSAGADGIIATNTTLSRDAVAGHSRAEEKGGLSGAPLKDRALAVCKLLYRSVPVPIIAVGGIFTAEDAYARIRAGASLVEIYTALVYEGPSLPVSLANALGRLLKRDGLSLQQAIGLDAKSQGPRERR